MGGLRLSMSKQLSDQGQRSARRDQNARERMAQVVHSHVRLVDHDRRPRAVDDHIARPGSFWDLCGKSSSLASR